MSTDAYKSLIKYCKSKGLHSRMDVVLTSLAIIWIIGLILFSSFIRSEQSKIFVFFSILLSPVIVLALLLCGDAAERKFYRSLLPKVLFDEVSTVNSKATSFQTLCENSLLKAFMCRFIVSDQINSGADIVKITMLFDSTDLAIILKQKELNTCPIGKITLDHDPSR